MAVSVQDMPRKHRLTVTDYHRMGEVGILARDARVELIEGEIIDISPIGSRHSAAVNRLVRILDRAVGSRRLFPRRTRSFWMTTQSLNLILPC